MGDSSARTIRIAKKHKNNGFNILPIQTSIFPGRSEKNKTTAKKRTENTASAIVWSFSGNICSTPTENATVAQRGIAKKGPIVKYKTLVKQMP